MKTRHVARHLFQGELGYFARMAVPVALRPIIGKKELWAAIKANSDAGAVRKLPAAVVQFQALIDAARAEAKAGRIQSPPPHRGRSLTPRQLAVDHYNAQIRSDDEFRNADHRYAHGFVDEHYVAALKEVVAGAADNRDFPKLLLVIARYYQANGNLRAEVGTPEWRGAVRALAVAELEALTRTAERDEGNTKGQPSDPLLIAQPEPVGTKDVLAARIVSPDSTKSLSEILPQFIKESGASPQTNYERQMIARLFEEHLGEPKPLYRITRQDVQGFKRALQELPSNHAKRFPGKTLPEAIKANKERATPYAPLDSGTINDKHLSKLRSMLNWCVNNDVIPDNPAIGIKIDTVKGKGQPPRLPFSPTDLTKIFSAELFDTSKPFSEDQWAAVCALFTGTRASELAQVKLDSVRHERGCLVIAIEEETKNIGSRRLIPVHKTLIDLGFEKHVAALRATGATHLFPNWYRKGIEAKRKAQANGKTTLNLYFPRFIPKAFCVTILPKVGINDGRKTWHSFRHTFKTGLARAGVPRSMQDDLCGHTDSSAGAGYVHGESVEAMKEAIEKLRFDGFVLAA